MGGEPVGGFRTMWLSWRGVIHQGGLLLLPLLPYHAFEPLQSPKSGILAPPISSISHDHDAKKRKTACKLLLFTILASSPQHSLIIAAHTAGYPVSVAPH
jgi:hypothetical protein